MKVGNFKIDSRLSESSLFVADWPLSTLLMKNESQYPWFILVPRKEVVQDIFELESSDRQILMEEISALATQVQHRFKPDKINVATLGNQVSQLHIHVVGRFRSDPLWPESIWQKGYQANPYEPEQLKQLMITLDHFQQC